MCYVQYVLTLCFFVLPSSSSRVPDQNVNVNLETMLEFSRGSVETDVNIIDKVQSFLAKVKGVLDESRRGGEVEVGDGRRSAPPQPPPPPAPTRFTFTEFLRRVLQVLAQFDDDYLQTIVAVFDDEARRYHYEGCKFYELLHHPTLRRQIAYTLNTMKGLSTKALKEVMNRWQEKFEKKEFTENERDLYDFLDTLYDQDSRQEMSNILEGLESYRRQGGRTWVTQSPGKVVKLIRSALQNIIFNQYSKLNNNVRKDLKLKIASFFVLQDTGGQIIKIGYITKTTEKPEQLEDIVVSTTEKAKTKKKNKLNKAKESKSKKVGRDDVVTEKLKDDRDVRFISLYAEEYRSKATKGAGNQAGLQKSSKTSKPTVPTDTTDVIKSGKKSHRKGTPTISTTSTTTPTSIETKKKKHKKRKESKPKSRHRTIKNDGDDSERPGHKKTLQVHPDANAGASSLEEIKVNEDSYVSENEEVSSKGDQTDDTAVNTDSTATSSSREGSKESQESVFSQSNEPHKRARVVSKHREFDGKSKKSKNKKKNKLKSGPKTASGKTSLPLHEIFMQYNAIVDVESSPSLKRSTPKTKHVKSQSKIKRKGEHSTHTSHRFRNVVSHSDTRRHGFAGKREDIPQMPVRNLKFDRSSTYKKEVLKRPHKSRGAIMSESDVSSKGLSIESFEVAPRITRIKKRRSFNGPSHVNDTKEPNTKTKVQTNETVQDQNEIISSSDPDELESHSAEGNIEDLANSPTFSEYNDTSEATNHNISLDTNNTEFKVNKSNDDSNKVLRFEDTKTSLDLHQTTQAKQVNGNRKVQDLKESKQIRENGTKQNNSKEIIQAQVSNAFGKNNQSKDIKLNEELVKNKYDKYFKANEEFRKVQEPYVRSTDFSTQDELRKHGNSKDLSANEGFNNMKKYNNIDESKELIRNEKLKEPVANKHDDNIFKGRHALSEGVKDDINTANQEFLIQRIWNLEHELEAVKHKIYKEDMDHGAHPYTGYKSFDDLDNLTTMYHVDKNEAWKSHYTENLHETSNTNNLLHDDLYWHPTHNLPSPTSDKRYTENFMSTNSTWQPNINNSTESFSETSKSWKSNTVLMPSTDMPNINTVQRSTSNVIQVETTITLNDTSKVKRNFDTPTLVSNEINGTNTLTSQQDVGTDVKTTKLTSRNIDMVRLVKSFRTTDDENKTNTDILKESHEHDTEFNNDTRPYDDYVRNDTFSAFINPQLNNDTRLNNASGRNNTFNISINPELNNDTRYDDYGRNNNSFGAFWSI